MPDRARNDQARNDQATHALVGNAAPALDHAAAIDAHPHVWRFNNCPGMETGLRGRRTTMLWLVNSGGSMAERLSMRHFTDHPAMRGCDRLGFPVHPSILRDYHPMPSWRERLRGARNDWTDAALDQFGETHAITILPRAHYVEACNALGLGEGERRSRFPSTGFLAAHWLLTGDLGARATLYGFTWEGWNSHAWTAERDWFAAREREGRVVIDRDP